MTGQDMTAGMQFVRTNSRVSLVFTHGHRWPTGLPGPSNGTCQMKSGGGKFKPARIEIGSSCTTARRIDGITDLTGTSLPPDLRRLEAEAIYIFREVAAEFRKPVLLYSIGKDFSVLLHLRERPSFPRRCRFRFAHRHDVEVPRNDPLSRRYRGAA